MLIKHYSSNSGSVRMCVRFSMLLASVIVLSTNDLVAQTNFANPTPPFCPSIEYVSGAGVRLRAGPNTTSAIKAVLTFNTDLCVHSVEGEWTEVSLVNVGDRGWIPTKLLSAQKIHSGSVRSDMFRAQGNADYKGAAENAERLLESEDHKAIELQRELMYRIETYYKKDGNTKKAAEYKSRRQKLVAGPKPTPNQFLATPESGIFESWFFVKFENTSGYENGRDFSVESDDVVILLDELEADGGEDNINFPYERILGAESQVLAKIYLKVFGDEKDELLASQRKRLRKKSLLKEALAYGSNAPDATINAEVVAVLPSDLLNEVDVFDFIISRCGDSDLADAWLKITQSNVRRHPVEFIRCLSNDGVLPAIGKHGFLLEQEVLKSVLAADLPPEKLEVYYSKLSPAFRGDSKTVNRMVALEVDIFRHLPPELRKSKAMRAYAAKTSRCENLVAAGPADRELFLLAAAKMNVSCIKAMAPSLRKDILFAKALVAKQNGLVGAFDEAVQANSDVVKAVINAIDGEAACPYSAFPKNFPLKQKRLIVKAVRRCLLNLTESDFKDAEIYKAVVAGTLEMPLLMRLPYEYTRDPKVPVLLPSSFVSDEEKELLDLFTSEEVLLDVARKSGVKVLAGVTATSASEYEDLPEEERYWSPAKKVAPDFWNQLIEVSKKRKDGCGDWSELIDSWRLSELRYDGRDEEPTNLRFPVDLLNQQLSCSLKMKDSSS